ncbi:hypothetical protein GW17_00058681 [Ensete ventricosum]|nr:hypothetical protein GW17_00058681 [Ensete ventricosum]
MLAVGLPAGVNPLRAGRSRLALTGWPLPVTPCKYQAMAGCPCRGPGRGQPPLHADSMHVAAPPPQVVPTFAANRCNKRVEQEIVYPRIPDPDGEDEGVQASSSLAVSTRWISAAKLLQSDLATLA